jgi:hypothetical protein
MSSDSRSRRVALSGARVQLANTAADLVDSSHTGIFVWVSGWVPPAQLTNRPGQILFETAPNSPFQFRSCTAVFGRIERFESI